jgi:hypothetical protein
MGSDRAVNAKNTKCIMCGVDVIHGTQLMSRPLCHDCETQLGLIDNTSDEYLYAIDRLKDLWSNRLSRSVRNFTSDKR